MRFRPSMIVSTLAALLMLSASLWAYDVTPDMASAAARTHIQSMQDTWGCISNLVQTGLELERTVPLIGDGDDTVGYVAELTPHGFVLLSADSEIYPVIAYSYRVD
ncbi:hypothetical protein GF338_10385, partial [candidate division WOR-3 bacterium]|nr:hypothetical protein [candidate division WOR-3 bacterium]